MGTLDGLCLLRTIFALSITQSTPVFQLFGFVATDLNVPSLLWYNNCKQI